MAYNDTSPIHPCLNVEFEGKLSPLVILSCREQRTIRIRNIFDGKLTGWFLLDPSPIIDVTLADGGGSSMLVNGLIRAILVSSN